MTLAESAPDGKAWEPREKKGVWLEGSRGISAS